MTVGLKVIDRKRAIMVHMRVKRQHQCRTLLHNPYPRVATAMEPTLMAFGTLKPTFQIQIVGRKIGCLTTRQTTPAQSCSSFWRNVGAWDPRLTPTACRRKINCASRSSPVVFVVRPQGAIHRLQVLDVGLHLRQGLTYDIQAAVNAAGQTRQQRLGSPPFFAPRLRSSASRTSWRASLIRKPGG